MTTQETAHAIALIVGLPMLALMILFHEPRSSSKPTREHTGKIARQRVRKTNHNRKDSK